MKKILLLTSLLFGAGLMAQNSINPADFFIAFDQELDWVSVQPELRLSQQDFFEQTYTLFGLEKPSDMRLANHYSDEFGWTHYRYHQFHKDVRVEGASYILHEKNGRILKANGHLIKGLALNKSVNIDAQTAIDLALIAWPAERYKWENPVAEQQLKNIKNDPRASHYPSPELVFVDLSYPNISGQFSLAYKMDIYAEVPLEKHQVWVDARTGNIIKSFDVLHTTGVEGTAMTRYHGERKINTTLREDGVYILHDDSRGQGITTLDANNEQGPADFEDDDNFWDNVNPAQDEVATDAHFGAAASYDYFKNYFGWSSFDNEDSPIISNVHVGENFNNAFWDGYSMNYGDGDSSRFYPLTAIDVCGHELAHGVTQFSANLIYAYESGALNESFSDIFGKTIEQLYTPQGFSWVLGERMLVSPDQLIRDMSDPNSVGHPKYYKGEHWFVEEWDNGGVHFNSGVQNYWYYLLCEGQEGINEAGYAYDVPAIGMEKAMQIAFRNLSVYLTEDSDHADARRGSLEAAADLYGICSEEYLAVATAWFAVGLGYEVRDGDLVIEIMEPELNICEIDELVISFQLFNNGCTDIFTEETPITIAYQLDEEEIQYENLVISEVLTPTNTQEFSFSTPIQNPSIGTHELRLWFELADDTNLINNEEQITIINRVYQNTEMALESARYTFADFCDVPFARGVSSFVEYQGCDLLPSGSQIPFEINFKGEVFASNYPTDQDVLPYEDLFLYINYEPIVFGFGRGSLSINYPGDQDETNNTQEVYISHIQPASVGWLEAFTANELDSTRLAIADREINHPVIQSIAGEEALLMTGEELFDEEGEFRVLPIEDPEDFLRVHSISFGSILSFCPEIIEGESLILSFDLLQTRSDFDYESYEINPDFSTMLGVIADGEIIGDLIYGGPQNGSFEHYEFELGEDLEGTFRVAIMAVALDAHYDEDNQEFSLSGDNNIIDNIELKIKEPTSVIDPSLAEQFNIYPNPSANSFQLETNASLENLELQIFNPQGQLLEQYQLTGSINNFEFGQQLAAGLYILKLRDKGRINSLKLIKQ